MRFLGVDYTRRLVIDAAKQQGYRLMLKPKMLEHTGTLKRIKIIIQKEGLPRICNAHT